MHDVDRSLPQLVFVAGGNENRIAGDDRRPHEGATRSQAAQAKQNQAGERTEHLRELKPDVSAAPAGRGRRGATRGRSVAFPSKFGKSNTRSNGLKTEK